MSADISKPRVYRRSHGKLLAGLQPIVVEIHSRKKKSSERLEEKHGEKYSDGLAEVQRVEGDLVRLARRATTAVAKGLDTYDRERSRSAAEKTDGAIEDFPHNSAKALSESLKEASEIPLDIADSATSVNYRRRMRRNLQRVSKALRVFRL
jgi:formiminotetrahydrofolate cyclodeaminase